MFLSKDNNVIIIKTLIYSCILIHAINILVTGIYEKMCIL